MANSFRTRQLTTSYRIKSPCVLLGKIRRVHRRPVRAARTWTVRCLSRCPPSSRPRVRAAARQPRSLTHLGRSRSKKSAGGQVSPRNSQIPTVPSTVCRHQDVTQLREVRGSARTRAPLYSFRLQPLPRSAVRPRYRARWARSESERASESVRSPVHIFHAQHASINKSTGAPEPCMRWARLHDPAGMMFPSPGSAPPRGATTAACRERRTEAGQESWRVTDQGQKLPLPGATAWDGFVRNRTGCSFLCKWISKRIATAMSLICMLNLLHFSPLLDIHKDVILMGNFVWCSSIRRWNFVMLAE
jgi:hypothetical protein